MILLQHAGLPLPKRPSSSLPMSVAARSTGTLQHSPQKTFGQEASISLAGEEELPKGGEQDSALEELCKPLYCKLCNVTLNSAQQAQAHYQGKNHGKKLRNYYAANSCPPPARMSNAVEPVATPAVPVPPQMGSFKPGGRVILATENDYCKLCDASFSSPAVAQAHYQGKNHAKRLRLAEAQSNSFSESSEAGQRRTRKEGNEYKMMPNRRNMYTVQNNSETLMHISGLLTATLPDALSAGSRLCFCLETGPVFSPRGFQSCHSPMPQLRSDTQISV
ncbi:zinc finger matrin-type 3 [Phyllostomus discolor]|uniref:Zinc finger matrin-type 3 n=1 Tax=Phyllostomus discolor TaxID=89673 RepID=A0A834EMW5_9CHIR|nr:zinc finger matrin-type 3 [Phyllostomus discolor]